jgi:DNA-binding transcriptional LysR family regulator
MELRHLRYFVAVAEELSFSKAAQRLHLAQPPLSKQIRDLESELGTPLFLRRNRRIDLTAEGKAFLERSRQILRDVEAGVSAVKLGASGEAGLLRLGFMNTLSYDFLPRTFRSFKESNPGVRVEFVEAGATEQITKIRDGRLEGGFIGQAHPNAYADIAIQTIFKDKLVAALPEQHPLAAKCRLRLSQLRAVPMWMTSLVNAPFCNPWLLGILKSRDILPPLAGEVASASSALMQISIGEGFVLVPEQISRISTPGVVFRSVLDLRDRYDFSFAWKQGHETAVLKKLLNHLVPGSGSQSARQR